MTQVKSDTTYIGASPIIPQPVKVDGLEPNTEYKFRAKAVSHHGIYSKGYASSLIVSTGDV